jgi:hypothetical protein
VEVSTSEALRSGRQGLREWIACVTREGPLQLFDAFAYEQSVLGEDAFAHSCLFSVVLPERRLQLTLPELKSKVGNLKQNVIGRHILAYSG